MSQPGPLIRNISDTARWAAVYRARESERPDALFRDPFARRLAGERGEQIARSMPINDRHAWSWITRTVLFDQFISEQVAQGVDMVINLAAGLDVRQYRMTLPPALQWVEVDLPEILDYKADVLASEKPVCALEQVRLDLSDLVARRALFAQLAARSRKTLIVSEGLLVYLTADEVGALAEDLAAAPSFQRWVFELASPGLLRMVTKHMGSQLSQAGVPLKFAPEEGPEFFTRFGWRPIDVRGLLKTAARLKRLSLWMRLLAMMPDPKQPAASRPWSGVCLFERT